MFALNTRQFHFGLLLTFSCFSTNAAVIYKWIDKKGVTHFSQVRPLGQQVQEINSDSLEPSKVGSVSPTRHNADIKKPLSQSSSIEDKQQAIEICTRAKHSLNLLTTHTNLVKQTDDGNEPTTLTEEQRKKEIKLQRERVNLFCSETK